MLLRLYGAEAMTPNVRFYTTEQGATDVEARLKTGGFNEVSLLLPSKLAGKEDEAIRQAIRQERLPERMMKLCTRRLKEGRALVAVRAPFWHAREALEIMETADSVDSDLIERYEFSNPSPFSDMMRMPTLSKGRSSTQLLSSSWSMSSMFGLSLLSKDPAPLSSSVGMSVLSPPRKNWRSSFGLPLLGRRAAPLSSLLGMPPLKRSRGIKEFSFGMFPLIMRNPTPFSSLFGLRVLRRKDQKEGD
jgi:hypothetical protein